MKVIKPGYQILTPISQNAQEELKFIEQVARTCYKSEDKIREMSYDRLLRHLLKNGHEAMLEHSILSVKFVVDRGISHELVRHRMASFAQESTRYCNYSQDKFNGEITVIEPLIFENMENTETMYNAWRCWETSCLQAEKAYFDLLDLGYSPQIARAVLPTSLKTEVVMTTNYREWRHVLKLRCDHQHAHPEMVRIMRPLLSELQTKIPLIFDDIV